MCSEAFSSLVRSGSRLLREKTTSAEAEYMAQIFGKRETAKLGVEAVVVKGDNKGVIEQMQVSDTIEDLRAIVAA